MIRPGSTHSGIACTSLLSEDGWVAFNDDLRIVASGGSEDEAIGAFYDAVAAFLIRFGRDGGDLATNGCIRLGEARQPLVP